MTTAGYQVNLDRLLTREHTVEIEVPATTTYAYDTQELQTGDRVSDGAWWRDSDTELAIGLNDSNGLSFPDLTLPTNGVEVAWDDATATILNVTDMVLLRNPFGLPLGILLPFRHLVRRWLFGCRLVAHGPSPPRPSNRSGVSSETLRVETRSSPVEDSTTR